MRVKRSNTGEELAYEVDDVIAATGWVPPLQDLTKLGVVTFGRNKLPALTPFWESVSVPGVHFAGTITQAAQVDRRGTVGSVRNARTLGSERLRQLVDDVLDADLAVGTAYRRC